MAIPIWEGLLSMLRCEYNSEFEKTIQKSMSTSITDLPNVQEFAQMFDLEIDKGYRLVVTDWTTDHRSDHPENRIIIESVDVYDTDGNFVKTADLNILKNNIHRFTVIFQKQK